jgi:transcriptional regulator with XRE-family HTH domain
MRSNNVRGSRGQVEALVHDGLSGELSALRERAGLSRKRLADLSNVSDGTIKAIETGDSEKPHPQTLRLLAAGLATQSLTGRADPEQVDTIYVRLMRAAGYLPGADYVDPETGLPQDIRDRVAALVGADEGLVRAILADLTHRPPEGQRSALRFLADALRFSRETPPRRLGR